MPIPLTVHAVELTELELKFNLIPVVLLAVKVPLALSVVNAPVDAVVDPIAPGLTRLSVPPSVRLPDVVTVPVKVNPLTVPVPLTEVTVPLPPEAVLVIVTAPVDELTLTEIFVPAVNCRVSFRLNALLLVPSVTDHVALSKLMKLLSICVDVRGDPLPALVTITGFVIIVSLLKNAPY
jgi:hypothetical protein